MAKKPIQIRVEDGDLTNWKKKAEDGGQDLSEWIRERCNEEGRNVQVRAELITEAVEDKKPRARKSEFAEAVAERTKHEVGCSCFDCVQTERFFKSMRKES